MDKPAAPPRHLTAALSLVDRLDSALDTDPIAARNLAYDLEAEVHECYRHKLADLDVLADLEATAARLRRSVDTDTAQEERPRYTAGCPVVLAVDTIFSVLHTLIMGRSHRAAAFTL